MDKFIGAAKDFLDDDKDKPQQQQQQQQGRYEQGAFPCCRVAYRYRLPYPAMMPLHDHSMAVMRDS